jgi:hypothetical protein
MSLKVIDVPAEGEGPNVDAGMRKMPGASGRKKRKVVTPRTLFDQSSQPPLADQQRRATPLRPPSAAPLFAPPCTPSFIPSDEPTHRRPIRQEQSSSIAPSPPRLRLAAEAVLPRHVTVQEYSRVDVVNASSPARDGAAPASIPSGPVSTTPLLSPPPPPPILSLSSIFPPRTQSGSVRRHPIPPAPFVPSFNRQVSQPPFRPIESHPLDAPPLLDDPQAPFITAHSHSPTQTQLLPPIELVQPLPRTSERLFACDSSFQAQLFVARIDEQVPVDDERVNGDVAGPPSMLGGEFLDEDIELALLAEHTALYGDRDRAEGEEGVEVPPGSIHVAELRRREMAEWDHPEMIVEDGGGLILADVPTYIPRATVQNVTGPIPSSLPLSPIDLLSSPVASPLHSPRLSPHFRSDIPSSFSGLIHATATPDPVVSHFPDRPSTLVSYPPQSSAAAGGVLTTPVRPIAGVPSAGSAGGSFAVAARELWSSLRSTRGGSSSSLRRRKTVAFSGDDESEGGEGDFFGRSGLKRRYSLTSEQTLFVFPPRNQS